MKHVKAWAKNNNTNTLILLVEPLHRLRMAHLGYHASVPTSQFLQACLTALLEHSPDVSIAQELGRQNVRDFWLSKPAA